MSESQSTPSLLVTLVRTLARLGRFALFLATAGWLFPHVCTEGMDLTRIQDDHTAGQQQSDTR